MFYSLFSLLCVVFEGGSCTLLTTGHGNPYTKSMAYGNWRFNSAFTRTLQSFINSYPEPNQPNYSY